MATTAKCKRHALGVLQILNRTYPEARCALNFRTPLELLIATFYRPVYDVR